MVITVLVAVIAFGGGFILAGTLDSDDDTMSAHHEEMAGHEETTHSHSETYAVNATDAPSVTIVVTEDAVSGWNVHVATEKFSFTPESVNGPNVLGQGHAHLYVDGEKVARLYGSDFHYPVELDGSHEFRVTLNANDHSEYTVDGVVIDSTASINHSHE